MEYVGWKSAAVAGRYAGVTASVAASRRTKSLRDTALTDADALPLLFQKSLWSRAQRSLGTAAAESLRGSDMNRSLGN